MQPDAREGRCPDRETLCRLADRAAISDVVIAYASALDRRDWALLRSMLCERVRIDYTSFDPSLDCEMPADEWVDRVRQLEGFTATQHLSSNHVHDIRADEASCISQMQAAHFLRRADGEHVCVLHGQYTHSLLRRADGWKIAACRLTITARTGDARVFDRAFGDWHRQARASGPGEAAR